MSFVPLRTTESSECFPKEREEEYIEGRARDTPPFVSLPVLSRSVLKFARSTVLENREAVNSLN